MITLDPTDWATLTAIQKHIAAHGYPPSLRELAQSLGLGCKYSSVYRLTRLARTGAIRRTPRINRGITVQPATYIIRYGD